MQIIAAVALKELRDGLRNRWVLAITLVFAVLATSLSYFGAAASGAAGVGVAAVDADDHRQSGQPGGVADSAGGAVLSLRQHRR